MSVSKQKTVSTTDRGTLLGPIVLRLKKWKRAHNLIAVALCLLLSFFVLGPVWELIKVASTYSSRDVRLTQGAEVGAWTSFHFKRMMTGQLGKVTLWEPLLNSIVVALATTLLSVTVGGILAWLVVRTDMRFKNAIRKCALLPYMLPSWVNALAWIAVFKNERLGGKPGLIQTIFGITPPDWIAYGIVPIILSLGLHYFIFAYLFVSNALESVNTELEEMAETLGTPRWQILSRITFPLVLPALGSAGVLTISKVLGTFGTPAFLGLPVHQYTLPTRIYSLLTNRYLGDAFVLVLILVALASLSIYANTVLLGTRKSFVTIGGKGSRLKPFRLGALSTPLGIIVLSFMVVLSVGPLLILGIETFMLEAGNLSLDNFTLHYWIGASNPSIAGGMPGILRNPALWSSLRNSLYLAGVVALISGIVGFLLAYAGVRARGSFLAKVMEVLAFTPYIFPSIAFGGIYLSMFATRQGPIPPLYGTFALMVLVCVVKNLTFTSQSGTSAMLQLDKSLEETAETIGISWFSRIRRIILPLTRGGLLVGMLLTFVTIMRELSLIVLLVTPTRRTLTTLIFHYEDRAFTQHGNAVVLVLVFVVLVMGLFVEKFRASSAISQSSN